MECLWGVCTVIRVLRCTCICIACCSLINFEKSGTSTNDLDQLKLSLGFVFYHYGLESRMDFDTKAPESDILQEATDLESK